MLLRRRSVLGFGALAAPAILTGSAHGQPALPETSLRLLVGLEAGGGADSVARTIASSLQRRTGRRVVVENRTGSAGAVPGELVRNGPADATRLAFLSSTTLVSRLATKDFPFDPLTDLAPVTLVGTFPIGFALSPTLKADTLGDYVQSLRSSEPTSHRLGNTTSSAFIHVLNILLDQSIGTALEPVDYRGALPMVNDLSKNVIPAAVTTMPSLLPAHRGGRIRVVMTTGAESLRVAPRIPTARSLGFPQLEMEEWYALFASPRTPPELLAGWNRELRLAIADRSVADVIGQLGVDACPSTPEDLTKLVASHRHAWEGRMETVGMKPIN